ncbi:unnamed protein product [Clonostachys chloroleuca]|uniref:Secreted protein n=1 Tax=Clonostachys chloroleuca TaxID=1926264 RepID=A0AA35Q8L9_9HYPO|nr:unnamed protein product [Clonostachys chloroleuca]
MRFLTIIATALYTLGFVSAQSCTPNGPNGAHTSGTPGCTCNPNGSITCAGFQVCGVGNTNANIDARSVYTATVQCRNKGGQIVEVKTQGVTVPKTVSNLRTKNGCLTVPSITTDAPTEQQLLAAATCPNGNWSKVLKDGTITDAWTYAVTFAGFSSCPYVSLSGNCP